MPRFTLAAGRCIVRDGVPFATIHGVSHGRPYDPTELDNFAREVVAVLNEAPQPDETPWADLQVRIPDSNCLMEGIRGPRLHEGEECPRCHTVAEADADTCAGCAQITAQRALRRATR